MCVYTELKFLAVWNRADSSMGWGDFTNRSATPKLYLDGGRSGARLRNCKPPSVKHQPDCVVGSRRGAVGHFPPPHDQGNFGQFAKRFKTKTMQFVSPGSAASLSGPCHDLATSVTQIKAQTDALAQIAKNCNESKRSPT